MDAASFLANLREEVVNHAGVGHSLLGRMEIDPRAREDFKIFAGQHYALVGMFTRYLELLMIRAPRSQDKVWLAKVLIDEYGERSDDLDHAEHYQFFMKASGWGEKDYDKIRLHPAVTGFIAEHLRICSEEPFLVGLGAVGPGHEWAIPTMFDYCIRGLRHAGYAEDEIGYFTLHCEQDIDHGNWLQDALMRFADTPEAQEQIHRGCMMSLAAREQFWWGLSDKINSGRMKDRHPLLESSTAGSEDREYCLAEIKQQISISHTVPAVLKEK